MGKKSLEDDKDFSRVTDCRKEDIFDERQKIKMVTRRAFA